MESWEWLIGNGMGIYLFLVNLYVLSFANIYKIIMKKNHNIIYVVYKLYV